MLRFLQIKTAYSMISQFDGTRDNVHRGLYNKEELQEPEKAYGVIRKFMDKCDILKQTGLKDIEAYRKSAISHDLALACLTIPVETPEMAAKVLDTVSMLQVRFADNPRIDANTRNSSKDKLSTSEMSKDNLQMTNSQSSKSQNKASSRPSVKDKAKVFLKVSKSYTGGKSLFSKLKEKMETFAKENPKLLTAGGAAAMFAGIGSMNPQLAAAGAIIMSAGIKSWSDKLKNMRGLEKSNNRAKVQQPKLLLRNSTLNNVVIGTAKSGGGR